ncbi:MAG: type II secretion system minor pseudopilin GspH [Pseudomonadota bacterium]
MRSSRKSVAARPSPERSTCSRQSGFTLLEVLVVVFIIAVISGVSVLSLGVLSNERDVEREATRAMALFAIAKDEAMLQGREFGVEFQRSGYRFVEYDPDSEQWFDVPGDEDLLRTYSLPEEMELELYLDDQLIRLDDTLAELSQLDDEQSSSNPSDEYSPHVFLYSSGDMTPFELHVLRTSDNARIRFEIDLLGNARYLEEDDF